MTLATAANPALTAQDQAESAQQLGDCHIIGTVDELAALLGTVPEASIKKEVPFVHADYRAMIEASPFCVLATK